MDELLALRPENMTLAAAIQIASAALAEHGDLQYEGARARLGPRQSRSDGSCASI